MTNNPPIYEVDCWSSLTNEYWERKDICVFPKKTDGFYHQDMVWSASKILSTNTS